MTRAVGAVGIVAEYNPFHTGHAWHIAETKRQLGEGKPIVCVMSGNWVQRGECGLINKWKRAEMALHGGADLVLELPLPWAISSAENFARGSIDILKATGMVDTISFGSESGCLDEMFRVAEVTKTKEFQKALHEELDKGFSFAEARQKAVYQIIGDTSRLLGGANDNLGVEYIRAAGESFRMLAVPRLGAGHNSLCSTDKFASATYLRELARHGEMEKAAEWMEAKNYDVLRKADISNMKYAERAVLARLRQMKEKEFECLPDSGAAEGLPVRLVKAAERANSLEEFYGLAKTRRYAHSRIRRLALWAFLGMTEKDRPTAPSYLRVLGANERGRDLLRQMKKEGTLPVLTKPAHIRRLPEEAQTLFSIESRGTDLYGLCFENIKPCGMDYTTGPVLL